MAEARAREFTLDRLPHLMRQGLDVGGELSLPAILEALDIGAESGQRRLDAMRQVCRPVSDSLDLHGLCTEQRVHLVDQRGDFDRNVGGKARFLAAPHGINLRL